MRYFGEAKRGLPDAERLLEPVSDMERAVERPVPGFAESRVLAYSCERLFDLVIDVERYPEFLPWWVGATVIRREGNAYCTDQVVGSGIFRRRFRTRTAFDRPRRIDVKASGGLFRHFTVCWAFDPAPQGGCRVGLRVELEFRGRLLHRLFWVASRRELGRTIDAFEARARKLYGPPAGPLGGV